MTTIHLPIRHNMKLKSYSHILFLFFSVGAFALPDPLASNAHQCKTVPSSAGWPKLSAWQSLNKTLEGQLIRPKPPALVCDSNQKATYSKAACAALNETWFTEAFHNGDPVSAQWPNWQGDACLPTSIYNATIGCDTRQFPYYVVNATKAAHVAEAVKFAGRTGVRLSVKGTGHDFLGRSAAPGLMIWTHNIRGIDVIPSFKPKSCDSHYRATAAIKIAAGHVWEEVYSVGKKHKIIPVGGADGSVGLGGYLLGGGHSPISAKFGLASDNALEMEVVTPSGDIVTANDYQNKDLFWALKGGGGSTFGVLLSATLRTYPTFKIQPFFLYFESTDKEAAENGNDNFYAALGKFHTQLPPLSDANITGYWAFGPKSALIGSLIPGSNLDSLMKEPQVFYWGGWMLDGNEESLRNLFEPISKALNSTTGINSTLEIQPQSDIYDVVSPGESTSGSGSGGSSSGGGATPQAGYNLVMGSRLWDQKALSNATALATTFRAVGPTGVSGLFISGPGVRNPALKDASSFTPAWRKTYLHIATGNTWPYRNDTAGAAAKDRNTHVSTAALRNHAPDMGCYLNEADVMEPNFQQAFWGSNYKKLLQIKKKYDPHSVLWCKSGVGSESWEAKKSGEVCPVREGTSEWQGL